jgi:hypothetical protein
MPRATTGRFRHKSPSLCDVLYLVFAAAWALVASTGLAICRSAARIDDSEVLCIEERILTRYLLEQERWRRGSLGGAVRPVKRRRASH